MISPNDHQQIADDKSPLFQIKQLAICHLLFVIERWTSMTLQLKDFAEGLLIGLDPRLRDDPRVKLLVGAWLDQKLLHAPHQPKPDPIFDMLYLTPAGEVAAGLRTAPLAQPEFDVKRWPYVCGLMARKYGAGKDKHGLVIGSDCERHWLAGYGAGK